MAKTKKSKAGRIPKSIGGVKLPKELRRTGEALLAKADTPAGREVIAAGLTMAAAAATAAAARHRAAPQAADAPARPGQPGTDPQAIADAIGNAADAVLSRLFGGKRAG